MVSFMEEDEESRSFTNCQQLKPAAEALVQYERIPIRDRIWLQGNKMIVFLFTVMGIMITVLTIFDESIAGFFEEPVENGDPIPTLTIGAETGTITLLTLHQSVFSLIVLMLSAIAAGYFAELVKLPALLGMLIVGIAFKNTAVIDQYIAFPDAVSTIIRRFAFLIILLRAGLGLDAKALIKLKGACVRLAFLPCTFEALTVATASYLIFDLKPIFGLLLGFVLAAVSPAVIVPQMIELQSEKIGTDKGIPTLITAAASIDDVYAITLFTLILGFVDTEAPNASFVWTLIKAPLEVLGGILLGVFIGMILWLFPDPRLHNLHFLRLALLVSASCAVMFGTGKFGFDAVGPVAILVAGFVAALNWRKLSKTEALKEDSLLKIVWDYSAQPFLFSLIGFQLNLSLLDTSSIIEAVSVLIIGLVVRCLVSIAAVHGTHLNFKEKIFTSIAWLPKATVQAALAPVLLDMTRTHPEKFLILQPEAITILTVAIIAILITAPIGAVLIRLTSSHLLQKGKLGEEEDSGVELKALAG